MAVDEALLAWAGQSGRCCWRLYAWEEPTLSLGYFQRYDDRNRHAASQRCPAVRRLTGGGAILHDRELTYSFVAPLRHRLALRRDDLYRAIHTTLIAALARMGVSARLFGVEPSHDVSPPFLCFQRRTAGDIVVEEATMAGSAQRGDSTRPQSAAPIGVEEAKIAGSAQRRGSGAILQHGSILLARSSAAPELAGIEEISGVSLPAGVLSAAWLPLLSEYLAVAWTEQPLSREERNMAKHLELARYAADAWTVQRRSPEGGSRTGIVA